jgi:predicted tellurium resistance membrane protein TerC
MFKQFISTIPGADNYMIFSLLTFFTFFVLVGVYLIWMDKKHLLEMEQMPFNEGNKLNENLK